MKMFIKVVLSPSISHELPEENIYIGKEEFLFKLSIFDFKIFTDFCLTRGRSYISPLTLRVLETN